jgi:hypothetical protein
MWNPFSNQKAGSLSDEVARTIAMYREKQKQLEKEKESRIYRQVELWSIMNLSPELEKEYREISTDITYLINQSLAIEDYIRRLKLAFYRAKNGFKTVGPDVKDIMAEPDPTLAVKREVPRIEYVTQSNSHNEPSA